MVFLDWVADPMPRKLLLPVQAVYVLFGVMLTRKSSKPFVGGQKSGIPDWLVVLYRMSFPCQRNRYIHSFGVMLTRKM